MVTAGVLTLLVMGVLFPNLWYGMHESDLRVHWGYAERIADGEIAVHVTFQSSTRRWRSPCSGCPGTPTAYRRLGTCSTS